MIGLPYDLAFDVEGTLIKIQVKYAWLDEPSGNYVVDNRRTKTNRRLMLREEHKLSDFDFALVYIENPDLFYIFPIDIRYPNAFSIFPWLHPSIDNDNQG